MVAVTRAGARMRRRTLNSSSHIDNDPTELAPYIIYCLRHRETGRQYVGLSKRCLRVRLAAHVSQSRRNRRVRPGGLLEALRNVECAGISIDAAFDATIVCRAKNVAEARDLEKFWIANLQAAQPSGYNAMPGGASVGGPANSKPVSFDRGDGTILAWPSIDEAIRHRNAALVAAGQFPLRASTYYARLHSGWSFAEAFGINARVDGRARRLAIQVGAVECRNLREVGTLTGLGASALRSRLHRRRGRTEEISQDRRAFAKGRCPAIFVTWPQTGERITLKAFATRAGVPTATIQHRWHRIEQECIDGADANAVSHWLTAKSDRRKQVSLILPTGEQWQGGRRELARRMLRHTELSAQRSSCLGESGILRRLRSLKDEEINAVEKVRWAFGFEDSH